MPADFQVLQKTMTDWLREPEKMLAPALEARRLAIYRELVHNNIRDFVETAYPVLKSLLPEAEWDGLLHDFVAEHRAQSPYFRDIALEFRSWMEAARARWLALQPWARELLHYEWIELAADYVETEADAEPCEPDGDLLQGIPCLRHAVWPLVYRWPVHALHAHTPPAATAPALPVCLLVYRDGEDEVRVLEVHALAARLVELMQAHPRESGMALVRRLAAEAGQSTAAEQAAWQARGLELLLQLRQADVLRGVRVNEHKRAG